MSASRLADRRESRAPVSNPDAARAYDGMMLYR